MSQPQKRFDKQGFPIPGTFTDLPARTDRQEMAGRGWGTMSPGAFVWKKRLLWLLLIGGILGMIAWKFANPIQELYAEARAQMGARAYLEGDFGSARDHLDSALGILPERNEWRLLRAEVHSRLNQLPESLADFTAVMRDHTCLPDGIQGRAYILFRMNKPDEALAEIDKLVEMRAPSWEGALNARAYLCSLCDKNCEQALEDINLAIKLSPQRNAAFLDTRGYVHYRLKNYQLALKDLNAAIQDYEDAEELMRLHPRRRRSHAQQAHVRENLAVMYHHRAEVYQALKNEEKAAADYQKANEYGYDPEQGIL
ncbi:MAG: hypothetical protein SFX18_06270 [Pirellulales bacterium]|nr:hypothetical protein [Pirellulales bacterium]